MQKVAQNTQVVAMLHKLQARLPKGAAFFHFDLSKFINYFEEEEWLFSP